MSYDSSVDEQKLSNKKRSLLTAQGEIKSLMDNVQQSEYKIRDLKTEIRNITDSKMRPYKLRIEGLQREIASNQRSVDDYNVQVGLMQKNLILESRKFKEGKRKGEALKSNVVILEAEIKDLTSRKRRM